MADDVVVRGAHVRVRSPVLVFLLAIVTFGIYYLYWYYAVNRELRDAAGIDVSPFVALLAVTLGWVVLVPPFVSWSRTFERIRAAQRAAGVPGEASPVLGLVLYVVAVYLLPIELLYGQSELNRLWRAQAGA